jgi:MFS transporter, NNP family, nitrate/nitrite transporter
VKRETMIGTLLFLTAIFFVNFIARIVLSPLMPVIESDLKLDHGQAGVLFLLIASGYFVSLMASGYISSRLRHKHTIALSAVAVGVALLATAFTSSVWGVRLGLLIMGMAAGLYLPSGIATITALFRSQHWGKAIAVHELAPNLAFAGAPVLSDMLLGWLSWRGALVLVGLVSLLLGVVFARFGRGGEFPGETPATGFLRILMRKPIFWIMLVLFGLGISSTSGVYAMLPLFLVTERSMDLDQANAIVALSRIPSLGMALLSGWVADRIGAKKTMTFVLLFTGLMTLLLGLVSNTMTVLVVFLQATLAVCFFPAALAALSSIGLSSSRNVVISFTIPFSFLAGAGAIPAMIGLFGKAGSFAWGICLTGALIVMGGVLSGFLPLPNRNMVDERKQRGRAMS